MRPYEAMPLTVELRPAVTNLKKRGDPKPRVCTMSLYLTTGVQREAQSRLTFFFMAMGPDRRTQWFFPPPNMNRIDDLITGSSVNLPETIGLWLLTHGHLTNHMDLFQTLMTGKPMTRTKQLFELSSFPSHRTDKNSS